MRSLLCIFLAALSISSTVAQAESKLLALSSSQAEYAVGENVVLRAAIATKPDNTDYAFDVVGTLNGVALPSSRVTDFEHFATAQGLAAGSYVWTVTLVLQNAQYATDLKAAIVSYDAELAQIAADLGEATDPEEIATLLARQARYTDLKAAAEQELIDIRTPIFTTTHSFSVVSL